MSKRRKELPMKEPTPVQRLRRMDQSFDKDYSILAEDYEFFTTGDPKPPEPAPLSKAARKSGELSEKKSPKLS